jgi:tRNA threonylcarbamoyladenosine biosynthesis protein TsaB
MRAFMPPTLYLDAASPAITVGLRVGATEAPAWLRTQDEAGVGLFRAVEALTRALGLTVADVATVVFCEGPGSLLGVRLAAMALRTWMVLPRTAPLEVLGYRSLELVAASLLARGQRGPFHVIVDGRRATWNALAVDAHGAFGPIARRPASEPFPADEPVFHPQGFPLWQALPAGVQVVAYDPAALPDLATRAPLLRPITSPEAYMAEMPTYREWTHEHPTRPS